MKLIAQGAEARIYSDKNKIIKERSQKSYRIKELDSKIRGFRTRREAKILLKLQEAKFNAPKLLKTDSEKILEIELIKGKKLRDIIGKKNCDLYGTEIGKMVKKMHSLEIIHGDLTTSNMIVDAKLYFIDFGLSFFSSKIEDKAVDLHLLKRALESKHADISEECFEEVLKAYGDKKVISWLNSNVEKRGRNKKKNQL